MSEKGEVSRTPQRGSHESIWQVHIADKSCFCLEEFLGSQPQSIVPGAARRLFSTWPPSIVVLLCVCVLHWRSCASWMASTEGNPWNVMEEAAEGAALYTSTLLFLLSFCFAACATSKSTTMAFVGLRLFQGSYQVIIQKTFLSSPMARQHLRRCSGRPHCQPVSSTVHINHACPCQLQNAQVVVHNFHKPHHTG